MKIEYMREFVDHVTTRNYSRTAERLFISQPTLSKHVKSIEDELRMPLLDRAVHGVELTDAGRFAIGEFRKILETCDGIESRLEDMRSGFQGSIRLGLLYYATDSIFIPLLKRFRKLFPNVSVKTVAGQPDYVFKEVMSNNVDAGFLVNIAGAEPSKWPGLRSIPVDSEPCAVFCRKGDPLARMDDPALTDLAGRRIVHYANGEYLEFFAGSIEAWLESRGIQVGERVPLDSVDLLTSTIEETGAVAFMPKHVHEFHKRLISYQLEVLPAIETCCLFREDNSNSALELFLSTISTQ